MCRWGRATPNLGLWRTHVCGPLHVRVRVCACMSVFVCAYLRSYMHVCMHACMHACIRTYMHTCMHACIHACMHTCILTYIHIYMCMYICTNLHVHTVRPPSTRKTFILTMSVVCISVRNGASSTMLCTFLIAASSWPVWWGFLQHSHFGSDASMLLRIALALPMVNV